MRKRLGRVIKGCLVGGGVLASSLVVASPAQAAADGWVYLVVQNSNCSNRGTISYVQGAVWTTYGYRQMWNGGDAGDNIVYPKVQFNVSNTFAGRALCVKGSASTWINVYRDFTPRAGQTVWL